MSQFEQRKLEISKMDMLSSHRSVIHNLHPLSKLIITILYIVVVVSFPKYELSGLIAMVLYPVLMFQLAGIPISLCFYKMRVVMPLVCAIGIVNPFLDRVPMMRIGNLVITGGIISMITLILKGIFSLMASFV